MNAKAKEKTCKNCKYYLCHYVIFKNRYNKTAFGHCINLFKKRRINNNAKRCKFWEYNTGTIEAQNKSVKDAIIRILQQFYELSLLLQDSLDDGKT